MILHVIYRHPAEALTIDQIMKFPGIASRQPKRKSVAKLVDRHLSLGFIERVRTKSNIWGYRLLNPSWADAFIRGDANKPWLKVPPNPPEIAFRVQDRHRLTYDVRLSKPDLETVKGIGVFAENGRTGGQFTLKRKEFTLSVNARTGNGQAWLFQGWDAGLLKLFSPELHQSLAQQVSEREGHEHISVPVEFLNHRIKVGGSDVVIAGSHYPLELDIQGPEKDMKKTQAVQLLTDQIRFNRMMLGIEESLNLLQTGQQQVSVNLLRVAEALDKIVNGKPKPEENPYQPPPNDKWDDFYR